MIISSAQSLFLMLRSRDEMGEDFFIFIVNFALNDFLWTKMGNCEIPKVYKRLSQELTKIVNYHSAPATIVVHKKKMVTVIAKAATVF